MLFPRFQSSQVIDGEKFKSTRDVEHIGAINSDNRIGKTSERYNFRVLINNEYFKNAYFNWRRKVKKRLVKEKMQHEN